MTRDQQEDLIALLSGSLVVAVEHRRSRWRRGWHLIDHFVSEIR
jgi:hypothetical protein